MTGVNHETVPGSEPAILLQSSGTEGAPKSIRLSYRMLQSSARIGREIEQLEPGDCWLNCLSQSHVGGLAIHYRCRAAGADMLLHHGFHPHKIEQDLLRHRVTHLSLVPVMLIQLLEHYDGEAPPETLRTVLVGGDRLSKSVAQRAVETGWPIVVCYGMTETASRITMLRLNRENIGAWQAGDVGPPLPGVILAIGAAGEVRVRSEALFADPEYEWVTGDGGRIDERGHLHLLGRLDHQILSAGYLIDPQMVEQRLLECPWVESVAVTAAPDSRWGSTIVALTEAPLAPQAEEWIQAELPSWLRPRKFLVVEQLQRNRSGKLNRGWLKEVVHGVE